jgi:hypothetical protein
VFTDSNELLMEFDDLEDGEWQCHGSTWLALLSTCCVTDAWADGTLARYMDMCVQLQHVSLGASISQAFAAQSWQNFAAALITLKPWHRLWSLAPPWHIT